MNRPLPLPDDLRTMLDAVRGAGRPRLVGGGVRDWLLGTGGKWVTMGIPSNGEYGIPADILYGMPVTCAGGKYTLVKGLEIDEFSRQKMDATLKELLEERDGVKHLLPG